MASPLLYFNLHTNGGFMKTLLFVILAASLQVQASIGSTEARTYSFRFQPINGDSYTYETKADSHEEAYEHAATACFNHYKQGRRISMDYGLDIIDVCANPRNM